MPQDCKHDQTTLLLSVGIWLGQMVTFHWMIFLGT